MCKHPCVGILVFVLGFWMSPSVAQTYEFSIKRSSTQLQRPALVDLLYGFFGPSLPGSGRPTRPGSGGPSIDLGSGDLTNTGRLDVRPRSHLAFSVQAATQQQITPNWAAVLDASLSAGQGDYFLPQGAAPFSDPMTLRFVYLAVQPRAGLRWSPTRHIANPWYIQFGVGYEQAYIQTTLQSLLLDVRSDGFQGTNFAFAEASWAPEWADTARFDVGLTYTRNKDYGVTFGVNFPIR
jgi:hypothetical protein